MITICSLSVFFFLAMTLGSGLSVVIFRFIVGGGVAESYLYPIYGGIVLLAGLIVSCTVIILDEIKKLKDS